VHSKVIKGPAGPVEVYLEGDGHPVVMLPSLGRGATRFAPRSSRRANNETDVDEWWMAGDAEVLVVQPEQDVMAVPENAVRIAEKYGDRATVLSLSNAGHAILPEQPEEVARMLLGWLDLRLTGTSS
jgi:pimeloyl-ACP methyl ester carboxylesterase